MRFSEYHPPFQAPCFPIASIAYSEQEGKNRQLLNGRNGEMKIWYSRTNMIKGCLMDFPKISAAVP